MPQILLHVTFTVSGLEPDYSGTVTFTDASGTQDVVPIKSNGAYSANLSNLTNGTITYLLSVSNPAGNVITVDPPLNLGDGSANAPAGTPQLPTLLNGYAVRPSWNVAGVDYYVGVPTGTVLKILILLGWQEFQLTQLHILSLSLGTILRLVDMIFHLMAAGRFTLPGTTTQLRTAILRLVQMDRHQSLLGSMDRRPPTRRSKTTP